MTISGPPDLIVENQSQRILLERLTRIATTDAEILITGPSGVGKELYARHAHAASRRRDAPFVVVNCSNLNGDMLENEVFGHARGAYTGAHAAGVGLATAAEGGTLFLDEVDALPLPSQAKLLRFIQQREYRRLGETLVRRANVRFIAASNSDLPTLVSRGHFREDFYYRLRVAPIAIPALAARPDDIVPLTAHFITRAAIEYGVAPIVLDAAVVDNLQHYAWPGNVRELENLIRYLTCLQLGRPVECADVGVLITGDAFSPPPPAAQSLLEGPMQDAKEALVTQFEQAYIGQALENSHGNITHAAAQAGKNRRAFFELMRKHGIVRVPVRAPPA